jgi:hypothetical protein
VDGFDAELAERIQIFLAPQRDHFGGGGGQGGGALAGVGPALVDGLGKG